MGAVGWALVESVDPCPPLEGEGALVTGVFRHRRGRLWDLQVEGEERPLGATGAHPLWSVDRSAWVAAAEFEVGERLLGLRGPARLLGRTLRPDDEPVYNIEVEGDHCYRVGQQGLLVHNQSTAISTRYVQGPRVLGKCGLAEDVVKFMVTGTNIQCGSVIQKVSRQVYIRRPGQATINPPTETFFETGWDVDVAGDVLPYSQYNDRFAFHPNSGEGTEGWWIITGWVRYFPGWDWYANRQGWTQGGVTGVQMLFSRTTEPAIWVQSNVGNARTLKAMWNCIQGETRKETDITGSGPPTF
jgi:hypothetical protein